MSYAFFKVRANDEGEDAEALNRFLQSHRVLAVRNEWVGNGEGSFWAFCVDYFERASAKEGPRPGERRTDYKEILPPEQFAIFARLRDVRKSIAEAEGVPVFTVFTNEQLAEMVKRGCRSVAALKEIGGIGEARAGKYGERFLGELTAAGSSGCLADRRLVPMLMRFAACVPMY